MLHATKRVARIEVTERYSRVLLREEYSKVTRVNGQSAKRRHPWPSTQCNDYYEISIVYVQHLNGFDESS